MPHLTRGTLLQQGTTFDGLFAQPCTTATSAFRPCESGCVRFGTLGVLAYVGAEGVGSVGALLLGFLGLSFLVGGLLANPGCEITALANIFLPRDKRMHFL